MQGLRSRAGMAAMTAGALALLTVPVVAIAKGPPDDPGGGNGNAKSVAPPEARIPDQSPGQAKKPEPAAKPAPPRRQKAAPPGHAKRAAQVSAPAGSAPNAGNGSAPPRPAAKPKKAKRPSHPSPPDHAKAYGHNVPPGHAKRSDEPAEG